jgi:hypothetical protein
LNVSIIHITREIRKFPPEFLRQVWCMGIITCFGLPCVLIAEAQKNIRRSRRDFMRNKHKKIMHTT